MSGFLGGAGRTLYQLGFEISPIILQDGIAAAMPGGYLPVVALTESVNFLTGLLSGGTDFALDKFFAHFAPVSGGTIIANRFGHYPFANQATAANSVITQPLRISVSMTCPVKSPGGYAARLATIMALQFALQTHIQSGGTFIVATPALLYPSCLLETLKDVTPGGDKQTQTHWLWEFEKPLLSLSQAAQAMNALMSRITDGLPTTGSLSGVEQSAGIPLSGATPAVVSSAQNLAGASLAPSPTGLSGIGGIS